MQLQGRVCFSLRISAPLSYNHVFFCRGLSFYAVVQLVVFHVYDFYSKAYGDKFTAQLAGSFVGFFAT